MKHIVKQNWGVKFGLLLAIPIAYLLLTFFLDHEVGISSPVPERMTTGEQPGGNVNLLVLFNFLPPVHLSVFK
jgi:hypothetical protein